MAHLRADQRRSIRLAAAGTFFVAYLMFQVVYPALPWFVPGISNFTWNMYSGRDPLDRFTVVFDDGRQRQVGNATRAGAAIRLLGASVDQRRFVPAWLCRHWQGATTVILRELPSNREEAIPCR